MNRDIPYDPSNLPNTRRYEDSLYEEVVTLEHALQLDTQNSGEEIRQIITGEGEVCIGLFRNYGLPSETANKLDTAIHDTKAIGVRFFPETVEVPTYIQPVTYENSTVVDMNAQTLGVFISDAVHSIRPLGGDEEIRMARDAGVKMAYTFALSLGIVDRLGLSWLESFSDNPEVNDLLNIGIEDIPESTRQDYSRFLPHRVAARLAIDRLFIAADEMFDNDEYATDVVEEYKMHRRIALKYVRATAYGFSMVDLATLMPLEPDDMKYLAQKLPVLSKHLGRIY